MNITSNQLINPPYALGHTNFELQRLIHQADYFRELTHDLFQRAGLHEGMSVLDLGCGVGDVSFLAAQFVGPEGSVTGVDKSPEAIDLARKRAEAGGLRNVEFVQNDIYELELEEPVDALVGRLVLMYFADPARELKRLSQFVKKGGIIAFHELDMGGIQSLPPCPVFDDAIEKISQSFIRSGADIRMGLKLSQTFREAGLPTPKLFMGAQVECGPEAELPNQVARITKTLLPLMERTGVATAEEVNVETLAVRIRRDAVARNSTLVAPPFVGAWVQRCES